MTSWETPLGTAATMNKTAAEVQGMIADIVMPHLNSTKVTRAGLIAGMNDRTFDLAARKMWKYGCTRGV